ncbi:DUF6036 family nucleotidyltransferase [Desulfosudis oleivorans]|uniref:DUF6036 domain-containing protein n=1 Tax=Desulfosudis oleivorans (strain DSM 6200 / JCM 39069 / Hxd3) TaxID=96561 RepID=A8ZXH7_DESOH|nr:DUF6036 family nucleotidyltransferase [Desulfosudis oleivorans]ABW66935.1 conserved hypothetical protein [Desulfosudis oleivorans Hxd3]
MLSRDFVEFIELLNSNSVRYLVVGGYAVAFHGHPRYTKDLDVWVQRSPDNAQNLLKALETFGFGSVDITEEDFLKENYVIQLGYPPNRIDLLTSIKGVDFDTCYASKIQADVSGIPIDFIDIDSLKKNKLASGRPQDIADVENLE